MDFIYPGQAFNKFATGKVSHCRHTCVQQTVFLYYFGEAQVCLQLPSEALPASQKYAPWLRSSFFLIRASVPHTSVQPVRCISMHIGNLQRPEASICRIFISPLQKRTDKKNHSANFSITKARALKHAYTGLTGRWGVRNTTSCSMNTSLERQICLFTWCHYWELTPGQAQVVIITDVL